MEIFNKRANQIKLKNIIFFGFLIVYSILLLYLSYKINISEDETYTINTTSRDLAGVIKQSYNFEGQPPFYFILLSLWRHLYPGIFFAKLFSLTCIYLSAFVFYRLVQYFSGIECSKWLLIIFLLNPFTVWAALEMRTYAFLILLSTLSIYFFFRYYFEDKIKFLYSFLVLCLLGIYTQYFFLFLIAASSLSILIFKGWKPFSIFSLFLIPIFFLFLPNLIYLGREIQMHQTHKFPQFSLIRIFNIGHTPQSLMLAINMVHEVWINRVIRLIFLFIFIYALLKLYRSNLKSSNLYLKKLKIILLMVFAMIILFSLGVYVTDIGFDIKYMVVVFPLFILLFTIFNILNTIYRRLIYGSVCIFFLTLLIINYRHPVKTYDYKYIAKYVEHISRPGQPILIYRPAIAMPFSLYYKGRNKIVPIPFPVKFDSSFLINIHDTNELKQSIENAKSSTTSYIMISDTTVFESRVNMNRKMVTNYIAQHYKITLDTLIYGWAKERPLRIMSFEKKSFAE